ncbi:MAG TPA: hypothetical protein ENH20_00245 [Candidatus Pacearchaeota archaeon]|nr:hypothetical protein [Candidatus Pacearchaeota archaeon]
MMSTEYLIIISAFIIYYITVMITEHKIIKNPKDIISKFLSVILLYAGISLVYFSLTGEPLPGATEESYSIYIFIIGFVAILWTIPELLKEFTFFKNFTKKKKNPVKK